MNASSFRKSAHPAIAIIPGLGLTQIIATIHVYLSNLELSDTLARIRTAGYLPVPNETVAAGLQNLEPAFWGGLFFSLTIGAGISLGAMAAAWFWVRVYRRRQIVLLVVLIFWLTCLVMVNLDGFALMPTLYFLIVAPAVFALTAWQVSDAVPAPVPILRWIHLLPVPLLALLWFTQYDSTMFLDLRDNLLLSNPYGRKFSQFYYDYTLYPAETFKSLNQKTIKTAIISRNQSPALKRRLRSRLIAYDYLPISEANKADLNVFQENNLLVLSPNSKRVIQVPIEAFFEKSRNILQQFSRANDRNSVFRQFTFASLLTGFPLLIYLVIHALIYYAGLTVMNRNASGLAASSICLVFGILVLVYFQADRNRNITVQDLPSALSSDRWQIQMAGLRVIAQKKLEIADFVAESALFKHSSPPVRYWAARAMAHSRRSWTFRYLLNYLDDANLNVRTMAHYALGLRRNRRALEPIMTRLKNSRIWYEQMYAYQALRSLGWTQTRSH